MAAGLQVVQVAVQVQEKWRQRGWVSARKQYQKQFAVRGMGRTRAVEPRVGRRQSRVDRGFEGNRRGLGRGFWANSGGRSAPV